MLLWWRLQLLLSDLKTGVCPVHEVACLVVDECHRCATVLGCWTGSGMCRVAEQCSAILCCACQAGHWAVPRIFAGI